MSGISACPLIPGALRGVLQLRPGLTGITIATGPSRKPPATWIAIQLPKATRPPERQCFGEWYEEGAVPVLCLAAVQGAGEDCIDAARAQAWELAEEVAGAFASDAVGGDPTLGGVLLESSVQSVGDYDTALDELGSSAAHSLTVEVVIRWSARGAS